MATQLDGSGDEELLVAEAETSSYETFGIEGQGRAPAATLGSRALRTTTLIMDTAREILLAKGYYGLRIDDIADAAGVSRASFYTYFASKRDLLLALGQETYDAMELTLAEIEALEEDWIPERVYDLVRIYMRLLEEHGAFLLVWSQATYGDDELAAAGVRARLSTGRRFGLLLQRAGRSVHHKRERSCARRASHSW